MFELGGAGLLAKAGLEEAWDGTAVDGPRRGVRKRGVEAIEDEEVALGVVHGGEGGDALEVVHGGEGVHLVVVNLVPGDVPAGAISGDADG